jgi:hypothetical protein
VPLPDEHRPGVPQQRADDLRAGADQRLGVAVEVGDPPLPVDRDERVGHVLERAGHRVTGEPQLGRVAGHAEQPPRLAVGARQHPPVRLDPADRPVAVPDAVLGGVRAAGLDRALHRLLGGRHVVVDEGGPEGRDPAVEGGRVDAEQVADLLVPHEVVGPDVPLEGADRGRGHDEVQRHPSVGNRLPRPPRRSPAPNGFGHRHPTSPTSAQEV